MAFLCASDDSVRAMTRVRSHCHRDAESHRADMQPRVLLPRAASLRSRPTGGLLLHSTADVCLSRERDRGPARVTASPARDRVARA